MKKCNRNYVKTQYEVIIVLFAIQKATDGGGRSSQSIVEVNVVDGENLKPPIYPQFAYDVAVSEGASIGTEVIKLEVNILTFAYIS